MLDNTDRFIQIFCCLKHTQMWSKSSKLLFMHASVELWQSRVGLHISEELRKLSLHSNLQLWEFLCLQLRTASSQRQQSDCRSKMFDSVDREDKPAGDDRRDFQGIETETKGVQAWMLGFKLQLWLMFSKDFSYNFRLFVLL